MPLSPDFVRSHLCAVLRVDPEQVVFKRDNEADVDLVELLLRDKQIDWALQGNGRLVRQAAMDLGISIKIGAAAEPGAAADDR